MAVFVSITWTLIAAFASTVDNLYPPLKSLSYFLLLTAPVLIFWAAFWIRRRGRKTSDSDAAEPAELTGAGYLGGVPPEATAGWEYIGPAAAAAHSLYGFGGWSLLLLLQMILGPIAALGSMGMIADMLTKLASYSVRFPDLYFLVRVEQGAAIFYFILSVVLSVLFFRKKGTFQMAYLYVAIYLAMTFVFESVATYMVYQKFDRSIPATIAGEFEKSAAQVTTLLLCCVYVLRSRRVNVTFRHRVWKYSGLNARLRDSEIHP